MATTSRIHITPTNRPVFAIKNLSSASAAAASSVLQQNHDEHHVFFNASGFHDHIVHHILTIYALGASPELIQEQYRYNASYQAKARPALPQVVHDMADPARFATYLGKGEHYPNFLTFFKSEIEQKGWQVVLNEYLFARDARADDMLVRLFSGLLHPFIHLGFALEFEQPALIAEALSQAAVHDNWLSSFYLGAERAAARSPRPTSLHAVLTDILSDHALRSSVKYNDANKLRNLVTGRSAASMIQHASHYTASPATLPQQAAEAINTVAYFTSGAQRPGKATKFDFFLIHCLNSSIFLPVFMRADWLRKEDKARVLEWKVRTDLLEYVAHGSPDLRIEDVRGYLPRGGNDSLRRRSGDKSSRGERTAKDDEAWKALFTRISTVPDDGHAPKLVRAIANGHAFCGKYAGDHDFRGEIGQEDWLPMAQMATDAVDVTGGPRWIRDAGFAEAWTAVPERVVASL